MIKAKSVNSLMLRICLGFLFFSIILPVNIFSQVEEYVRVNQVEVIVRAIDSSGNAVTGLKAEDFRITENGQSVQVTSCTEFHRKIGTLKTSERSKPSPRLFILYFWVWQNNDSYTRALDYIFKKVYRRGDTVLLLLPNYSRIIRSRQEIKTARREFFQKLTEWTQQSNQDQQSIIASFNSLCEDFIPKLRMISGEDDQSVDTAFDRVLHELTSSVRNEWRSFQQRYLEAHNTRLIRLARALDKIKNEKWALVFFQQPSFPAIHPHANLMLRLDNPDYSSRLRNFAQDMISEMNSPRNTPANLMQIEQAFLRAHTTYQMIQVGSNTTRKESSRHLVVRDVFSDWQWAFKRIARSTGGHVVTGTRTDKALARLVNAEDVYYRITYDPQKISAGKVRDRRKIKIKVKGSGISVIHPKKIRLSEIDEIKLAEFQCNAKKMKFILTGYSVKLEDNRLRSRVQVWITAETPDGKTMKFSKMFSAPDPFLEVTMNLKFPSPGLYQLYFTAEDRYTGLNVSEITRVRVRHKNGAPATSAGGHNRPKSEVAVIWD